MNQGIDDCLRAAFTPDQVIEAFFNYKLAKWDHFSALTSPKFLIPVGADGTTLAGFEKQLDRHARNICRRVLGDAYIFYPLREVEKEKEPRQKPRKYRQLSIASIRDALVQGILYSKVLYDPIEELFRKLDHPRPVSFSYRKGKSPQKAAKAVHDYLRAGYAHILDADLSKYFDSIPHDRLLDRFAAEIGGDNSQTYRLVRRFVHTDRVPFKTYKHIKHKDGKPVGYKIFHNKKPSRKRRGAGVPQGGVLSGMLANLYLHDFDEWVVHDLDSRYDLRYVRYADDFIIMMKSSDQLPVIRVEVRDRLDSMGLTLNDAKTNDVDVIKDGLNFVGFHFDGWHVRARDRNIERYKERILDSIQDIPDNIKQRNKPLVTLRWLVRRINGKVLGRSERELCPKCGCQRIGPSRSWMAFFQGVTDEAQIKEVDLWTRKLVYDRIYKEHGQRISRKDLRKARLKSLVNQWYGMKDKRLYPCLCEIDQRGMWAYSEDLFKGRTFETLHGKRTFYVKGVSEQEMVILVNKHQYIIRRDVFLDLWSRLRNEPFLSRAQLEREGYRNTSQLVALLARLPGVSIRPWPIRLVFDGYRPAHFMMKQP